MDKRKKTVSEENKFITEFHHSSKTKNEVDHHLIDYNSLLHPSKP